MASRVCPPASFAFPIALSERKILEIFLAGGKLKEVVGGEKGGLKGGKGGLLILRGKGGGGMSRLGNGRGMDDLKGGKPNGCGMSKL